MKELPSPDSQTVGLFIPCLVNAAFPSVGEALWELLEALGFRVVVPLQGCCGQPAFNAGYPREAAAHAHHWLKTFSKEALDAVVAPSGSCVAMVKKHYADLPLTQEEKESWLKLAPRIHEATAFLHPYLKNSPLKLPHPKTFMYHPSCHLYYDLHITHEPITLLQRIEGLKIIFAPPRCCGFGGLFSIKHPDLSVMMGKFRLRELIAPNIQGIVSSDAGCLAHLAGIHQKMEGNLPFYHTITVLHHAYFHLSLS